MGQHAITVTIESDTELTEDDCKTIETAITTLGQYDVVSVVLDDDDDDDGDEG